MEVDSPVVQRKALIQLKSDQGDDLGAPLDVPFDISTRDLQEICNLLLGQQVRLVKPYAVLIFLLLTIAYSYAGRTAAVFVLRRKHRSSEKTQRCHRL